MTAASSRRLRAPRQGLRGRHAALAVVVALGVGLTTGACTGGSDGPGASPTPTPTARPVTSDEADRLAVARFNVWDHRWVDLDLRVPVQGDVLHLTGRGDMRDHSAYAHVTSTEGDALLQWTLKEKAVTPTTTGGLPTPAPSSDWQTASLGTKDTLDAALTFTLNLASDRPENPLLLQQNGAEWVGTDTVDGTPVDVFTAPVADGVGNNPLVRYEVDGQGMLREVRADTGAAQPLVVTLTPSDDHGAVPLIPALAG